MVTLFMLTDNDTLIHPAMTDIQVVETYRDPETGDGYQIIATQAGRVIIDSQGALDPAYNGHYIANELEQTRDGWMVTSWRPLGQVEREEAGLS